MPWKPLPSVAFAICTYPFHATEPDDLPLQVGDCLYIIEQGGRSGDWYRGYLVGFPSLLAGLNSARGEHLGARVFTGIFPRSCVEVRELVDGNQGDGEQHTPHNGGAVSERDGEEDAREKRKSQALRARRLSRALSKKRSLHDVSKKAKPSATADEPPPRDPTAPKPIAPVPLLRIGDETGLSAEEPLVDEIASCLREWHDARLHSLLLAQRYTQLARVQDLIKRVDISRKQLMHDVMTVRELDKLREDTVWDLVAGNKILGEEVIVRNPAEKGRIMRAEDSIIDMTKLQAHMSIFDRPPKPPVDMHMLYHVLVDVRNIVCQFDQPATLQVYLCSKALGEKPKPLSENYAISVPSPEGQGQAPEEQTKSLFINLAAADVGLGGENSALYVVFKLLKDEPIQEQTSSSQAANGYQHTVSMSSTSDQRHGSLRGRRSMFGSQRKKELRVGTDSQSASRPGTAMSEHNDDARRSSASTSEPAATTERVLVKRTIGVAAIEIGKLASQQLELEKRITLWTPSSDADDRSDGGEGWTEIVRELARSPTGGFSRARAVKHFEVFARGFAASDLNSLLRNTPTLLHDIHTSQKLGFSGVPSYTRSDIYLTLAEPLIPRNASLTHSKLGNVPLSQRGQSNLANLQLTMEVRRGNGERIEDCIYTASNHLGHTAWRTTAVVRGEGWNQTVKLAVPVEDVPGSHVVMSLADSPNFPFALAWVPLWEAGAFVRDGDHQVALYVYDEYSSSVIGGRGAYLALPPWQDKHDPAHANASTVSLRTYLCSTEYSQDPNLLGLLTWRTYHGEKLMELLERFSFVPEIELVKLLGDVFTALFEILHEYAGGEAYEDLIFYNFVTIFGIARDRRFGEDLHNVIEDYAHTRHDWPEASQCFVRAFRRLLSNPLDMNSSRKLREAVKVGDQVLKLIIETAKPREEPTGTEPARHPNLVPELQDVFVALMALMRNPMPVLLGTQTLVVQHFHAWLPELSALMDPAEILEIATNLLDACGHAHGKLVLYRLVLILNYSRMDIFKTAEVRTTFIGNTFRWLAPCWGEVPEVTEQWRSQVRLCCSVVAAQMAELDEDICQYVPKLVESYTALQTVRREPKRTFSMLFPASVPFPFKPTPASTDVDEAMLEVSALLAAALTTQQKLYFDANEIDVPSVLMQALRVGQSILSCEAFPHSWLSLHVSHHRFAMTALQRISEVLIDTLPDVFAPDVAEAIEFDTVIWRTFFDTLFAAVSSPALAMESFPEQKRRATWKIAGDVRELGATLLKRSWDAIGWETDAESRQLHGFARMGGYQVQFVPELVGPIVELCLSVHASLRNVAVEVLRTMIISTWEIDQDLGAVQTAMIDRLDKLCRTRAVAESYLQKTFVNDMLEQFRPLQHSVEDGLYNAVVRMFDKIEDLLGMLANVHQNGVINETGSLVDTLRLMEFLKDVQSDEAYVRYVHQLADLQATAGNHTEAGLALRLHGDRYDWDPAQRVDELKELRLPAQTAFERKEALYFEMCQLFERGQSWQRALAAYRELACQYEQNIFDFSKLARTQRAMAGIHEKIASGHRLNPRYFRVVYRGLGFPTSVRNKEFIFEGLQTDRLATFEDRLQQLHPDARILRTTAEPDVEGQYLQVFAVSANKDLNHTVYHRTKVSQAAREHTLLSNPQKFATTTRNPAYDVPITEQVVEKIVYTTAEPFPTILRRSEVVATEAVKLSPIEAAVERTTRKTQELLAMEQKISSGEDEGAMTRLSEDLLLSVDADSDSSVARYRKMLPSSEVPETLSQEVDSVRYEYDEPAALSPMQNALKVALLDHAVAIRRCLGLYNRSAYLATKAELVPRFEATFEPELSVLLPHNAGLLEHDSASTIGLGTPRHPSPHLGGESQASAGAREQREGTTEPQDVHHQDTPPREGRRRSLPWLSRRSTSNSNLLNGDGSAVNGGGSHTRKRSRSRLRDNSLTRRLSSLRSLGGNDGNNNGKPKDSAELRPSLASSGRPETQASTYSSMSTAQLKNRLTLIRDQNGSAGNAVTATGEYIG